MKGSALAASTLLAATVQAVDGVVQWDISRRQTKTRTQTAARLLRRDGDTFEEVITNEQTRGGYFATCKVGTPPQDLTLQLDTGSSDIWVPSSKAPVCTKKTFDNPDGCTIGSFDSAGSTSFEVVGPNEFDISYVDGSHSKGDYFTDAFEIGGASLTNVTMGLGRDTDIAYGLVGVGYAANEAIVSNSEDFSTAYPNLPVLMMNEGLIKSNAYSLWLNDLDSSTGNILFGGIDTKKYVGDLTRIPISKEGGLDNFTSFMVQMTSLEATSPTGTDVLSSREYPIPVVLDSGTTLSYLPTDLAMQIWKEVGAVYSDDAGVAVLPCSMASSKGYFTFRFAGAGGPAIKVGMDELVLDLTDGQGPRFEAGQYRGQEACSFGIQNISSDPFLLGDTFLRSAYVVYDLVNNEVAIAPTDFNATESNIVAFESQGAPIPSATAAPSADLPANQPAATSPSFAAASGFSAGVNKNAASLLPALDLSKTAVMGVSLAFAVMGSGLSLI